MPEKPTLSFAVALERRPVQSRWVDHEWVVDRLIADFGGDPLQEDLGDGRLCKAFPGFAITLFPDEAEGYYLNVSSGVPSAFVSLRTPEEGGDPYPFQITASYNEAARWMDSGERVERVDVDTATATWLEQWVAANYRPEPKKRQRPRSFVGKEGRLRERGEH
jgi:hypothetical protein